jgi:hypothetical protein
MSIAAKRRETEVFSLSFLDCICCGFGAVLLVFLLTVSSKTTVDKGVVDDVRQRVTQAKSEVKLSNEDLGRLGKSVAALRLELDDLQKRTQADQLKLSERKREMLLMLQQSGNLKDAIDQLLGEKKNIPTEDVAPVPIPEVDRRQYLTGVKLNGEFVVFLIRISGSMLGETIDDAVTRLAESDEKKRAAPKWQRVVQSMEWLIATLDPETKFQILLFNEETASILPNQEDKWFSLQDKATLTQIIKRLHEIVPQGGANLERAFTKVRFLPRLPDSIVLLTDGLPTKSDSLPVEGDVDEGYRIRFFEIATKQLPPRIPVSTILFPLLSGDPGAPGLFWELANATRGALVSPSKSWPDT